MVLLYIIIARQQLAWDWHYMLVIQDTMNTTYAPSFKMIMSGLL
jgi:hypothetical protein